MSMRMTANRADEIATAITKKALEVEHNAQLEREKTCNDLLYTIYREYIEDALPNFNNIPQEFINRAESYNLTLQYVGPVEVKRTEYAVNVKFPEELPVPHEWRYTLKTQHPSFVAYDTILQAREELTFRANDMRADVKKNALSVRTVDKLMKAWPDAAQLIAEAVDYAVPPAVPYVPLHELMAKYARMLPAPGAANDGTVGEDE